MVQEEVPILKSDQWEDIEMAVIPEEHIVLPLQSHSSFNSTCAFSKQENSTLESDERLKSVVKLCGLTIFYLIVMVVEIVGGVKANSLAVMTDAAHLMTDVAGFCISLFTVWAAGWKATSDQSFGFGRLEVLGALLSVQLIWLISGILIYEAINRILHKNTVVQGGLMFAIAAFGFLVNLIMVIWLGHDHSLHACHGHGHGHGHDHVHNHGGNGHDHSHHACHDLTHDHVHNHEGQPCATNEEQETQLVLSSPARTKVLNINVQGAYLHVMADLIQSVGVMTAGAVIWAKPDWLVVDLMCTLVFSTFALSTTLPMLKDIFGILMQRTPSDINVGNLEKGLNCIKGVRDIYDLHVWAITVGKLVLSCHVVAEPGASSSEILRSISEYCEKTYGIHHVTVQIEQ